jgi:serine/threonine-protein kinase RsbW
LDSKNYSIEIASDSANLITVEEFISFVAAEAGLPESKIPGLMLAVTEATTNAIIHGNKKDASKSVSFNAVIDHSTLVLKIKDQGTGFDPAKIPDPTEPENLLKDSGRGLYLMRIYADDLKYNYTPEGTETILTINL